VAEANARPRVSISVQLFLFIFIVYFLTIGGLVLLVYGARVMDLHERLDRERSYFLNSISRSLVIPLWNYDFDTCEDIITSAIAYPDLKSIELFKEDGTFVVGAERDDADRVATTAEPAQAATGSAVEIPKSERIFYEGSAIGRIDVAMTDRFARVSLATGLWKSAGIASIIFCMGLIALFISIELGIIRRLLMLRNTLAAYSGTSLDVRARMDWNDEIGDLAHDFNDLAERIQSYTEHLEKLLDEKGILIREIHHRVKNNLQIIASIIAIQGPSIHDKADKALNQDMQVRVRSMAKLHEILYDSSDFSYIDPAHYLTKIAGEIASAYSDGRITIRVEAQSDSLSIDDAIPFGLIAVELITNAFKYAYPSDASGEVFVSYGRTEGRRRLEVRDEGVGLGDIPSLENITSLGFTLVNALSRQIQGDISMCASKRDPSFPGLRVVLAFPDA
jgi:two-component sensor histidine kinase